jgi:hypothetical protein
MYLLSTIIISYLYEKESFMKTSDLCFSRGIYFHGQFHSVTVVQPSYDLHPANLVRPMFMP